MIATLTWQPTDTDQPETVTIDMPAPWLDEFQMLRNRGHDFAEAVAWIPVRNGDGTYTRRLFRLARITATELDHLLDRAERNVLLLEEAPRLRTLVGHLVAGQCLDSRAMCEQHHLPPVAGCPYPRCRAARGDQTTAVPRAPGVVDLPDISNA